MSEESLKQLLDRLSADEAFRQRVQDDWPEASAEYDLSEAELVAFGTEDEEGTTYDVLV